MGGLCSCSPFGNEEYLTDLEERAVKRMVTVTKETPSHVEKISQGELIRIWKKFDKDGNDSLDKNELQKMLEKFLGLALKEEDLGAQDLDSHLAMTLGLAVKAAAEDHFGGNCVIENFKQDPQILTNKVFDLLDVNGNGDLTREEFLKNATQVLFNQSFLKKTGEIYNQHVVDKRLKSSFLFNEDPNICSIEDLQDILIGCPKYCYWMEWHRLYTTTEDGFSYETLKNAIGSLNEVLIVIRTMDGFLIGGFASEHVVFDGEVHGNCDNFIFSKTSGSKPPKIFHASGENMKFHIARRDCIMFGLDDEDAVGLFISNGMQDGRTTQSGTYESERLVPDGEFRIKAIEVWGPRE